jgi:23S rRNA pseudouridine1911/1915/1917 synthase
MTTQQFSVPPELSAERLDSYIAVCLPDVSRSQVKKLIEEEQILVNGNPAKASLKLKGYEVIDIRLPEPEPIAAVPENIPLNILYEDSAIIVVNKPAGMVVHPAAGHTNGTLVNALLYHCTDLAGIGGELRPGIVHRIDKDTSGILIVTKNDKSHHILAGQFKDHSIHRLYQALVHGCPKADKGTVNQAIGRHPTQRKKMSGKARQAKEAVTHWKVLARFPEDHLSLVQFQLETGRTHQIRVHFSEMNYPLLGDPLYGSRSKTAAIKDPALVSLVAKLPGQALHAKTLGFIHPDSGKYLEFSTEMPETLLNIVTYLNKKYSA